MATISNAMDVGDPSNFIRILNLFNNDTEQLLKHFASYSFTDEETRQAMRHIYNTSGYISDPHGAVGYLGLKAFLKDKRSSYGVFLETAHPVKFLETVEETLKVQLSIPEQISTVINRKKTSIYISDYNELKTFLLATPV